MKKKVALLLALVVAAGGTGFAFGVAATVARYLAQDLAQADQKNPPTAASVPAKNSLIAEALKRQQATAGTDGELSWLKKRTGINCGMLINDGDCLAMLSLLKGDEEIIRRVGELSAAGVKIFADKQSSLAMNRVPGEMNESGDMLYIYKGATLDEIRAFLRR